MLPILKVIFSWMKDNIWKPIALFFSALAVVFGLGLLFKKSLQRDNKVIEDLKVKVNDLNIQRRSVTLLNNQSEKRIAEIDRERIALREEVKKAKVDSGMTDEEVLEAFDRLGF